MTSPPHTHTCSPATLGLTAQPALIDQLRSLWLLGTCSCFLVSTKQELSSRKSVRPSETWHVANGLSSNRC